MNIAYLDCFSGVAGDMVLGALLDAGWPAAALLELPARLGLPGVQVTWERVVRHGLQGALVRVNVGPDAPRKHRHLRHIRDIIQRASLPGDAAASALRVFTRLAEAEAKVHGTDIEKVHFHEVGADDAIVDIVGACLGLQALGVARVVCSPIPTGYGTVTCDHGVMPVPAPATAELLRGVPLARVDEAQELTTPTGAALVTTLAEGFGPPPAMQITHIGYGAGTRENRARPNLLRVLVGTPAAAPGGADDLESDEVVVLEAQLDDAPGQVVAHAMDRLLAAGALDVFLVPIGMKKGRPGHLLTVLARPAHADRCTDLLLTETTTFGVRRHTCERRKLPRELVPVETPLGPIRVKVGRRGERVVQAWPEYEDCVAAAQQHSVPLKDVQQAALAAWRRQTERDE